VLCDLSNGTHGSCMQLNVAVEAIGGASGEEEV